MAKKYSGGVNIGTGFKLNDPQPIADYMVVEFFTDLSSIPNQFNGMHVFVESENAHYTKKSSGWVSELILPIDTLNGSPSKFLNERGEMVEVSSSVIYKSYGEIYTMILNSLLIIGQKYIISDYQTTHIIPNTSVLNECQVEPLIVTAVAANKLSNICYSAIFPQDIIFYEIENNPLVVPGCTKGYIYKRIDTLRNNNIDLDWRNVKYRRWVVSVNTEWVSGDEYMLDDLVYFNNEIYVCVSESGNWVDINGNFESTGINNGEYISLNNTGINIYVNNRLIIIPAGLQFKDITMFNDLNNIN